MFSNPTILVATATAYNEDYIQQWGRVVADALGGQVAHVRATSPADLWAQTVQLCDAMSPAMVVAAWPADASALREAESAAAERPLFLIDPRQHSPADVTRVVAAWSGDTAAIARLRLSGEMARQMGVAGQAIRIVSTDGPGEDRRLLAEHFRQARERAKAELALAEVDLTLHVKVSDDPVGELLVRVAPHDLLLMGGSRDWLMRHHARTSIPHDLHTSHSGPVAMLISPERARVSLSRLFAEPSVLIRPMSARSPVEQMVDFLVAARQFPWQLKPLVMGRVREISLGRFVRLVHARIPHDGAPIGCVTLQREPVDTPDAAARVTFLLLVPEDGYDAYLPVLARLVELAGNRDAIEAIARCRTPAQVADIIRIVTQGGAAELSNVDGRR